MNVEPKEVHALHEKVGRKKGQHTGENGKEKNAVAQETQATTPAINKSTTVERYTLKQSKRGSDAHPSEHDNAINANFWDRIRRVIELHYEGSMTSAMGNYELGLAVNDLKSDSAKYGAHAVSKLAAEVRLSEKTLYDYGTVAAAFQRAEVMEALTPDDEGHLMVYWSHFVELARVKNKKNRTKLLQSIRKNGWNISKLRAEIAKVAGKITSALDNSDCDSARPFTIFDNAASQFIARAMQGLALQVGDVTAEERKHVIAQLKEVSSLCRKIATQLKSEQKSS